MRAKDLTGLRFGRLLVLDQAESVPEGKSFRTCWRCQCDCGEVKIVRGKALTNGDSASCGCYRSECVAAKNHRHGGASRQSPAPEYEIWAGMIKRCEDPDSIGYPNYGGRGIRICTRWRESFAAFRDDMGPRPSPKHSIDRRDNAGDYEPSNCHWVTAYEQNNNRRHCVYVSTPAGKLSLKQAWRLYRSDMAYTSLCGRIRRGWTPEQAISTPPLQ